MAEMKINIGMKDLELLIGGDAEAHVQIRNTIVQQFTDKHLKKIASLAIVAEAEARIKLGITALIDKEIGSLTSAFQKTIKLTMPFEKLLKSEISKMIDNELLGVIEKEFKSKFDDAMKRWGSNIETVIESHINMETAKQVRQAITKKMEELKSAI